MASTLAKPLEQALAYRPTMRSAQAALVSAALQAWGRRGRRAARAANAVESPQTGDAEHACGARVEDGPLAPAVEARSWS